MISDAKRKELGLASRELVDKIQRRQKSRSEGSLNGPALSIETVEAGEMYLEPAPALLSQAYDEQLYYAKKAKKRFSTITFGPYIPMTWNNR